MNTKDTVPTLMHRFLSYELGLLSVKAALSTRDKNWPIYSESTKQHQRSTVQDAIRSVLLGLETRYGGTPPTEDEHVQFIEDTSDALSRDLKKFLFKGRFRVGVTQKLINLHLKYLWVAGVVPEPPHCPLDGIVRDLSNLNYDWTTSDSLEEYTSAILALRKFVSPRRLSEWELCEFRRRAQ